MNLISVISLSGMFQGRLRPAHLAWPRGATPRPRSGAESGRTPCPRGGGQEELPHVQGQKWRPGGATPRPRSGAAAQRSYPASEARGSIRGQGQRPGGETPPPRSSGCMGARGSRGSIPGSKSEGAAVRRYPSSKVRSSGCALLEQP